MMVTLTYNEMEQYSKNSFLSQTCERTGRTQIGEGEKGDTQCLAPMN